MDFKILNSQEKENTYVYEIAIDLADWNKKCTMAENNIKKSINIHGFRKGHVPVQFLYQHQYITKEGVDHETARMFNKELRDFVQQDKKFDDNNAIADASYCRFSKSNDQEAIVEVVYETLPKVTKFEEEKFSTITFPKKENKKIDQYAIDNHIYELLKRDCKLEEKDVAAENDMANIDFIGYLDDKPFPGGQAKNYDLRIGSHSFVDTFEQQLIGKKKGDNVDVKVKFPTDYQHQALAGKDVVFKVTVNKVSKIIYPDVDEKYLTKKMNFKEVKSLDELKDFLRNLYMYNLEKKYYQDLAAAFDQKIIETAEISHYPAPYLEKHMQLVYMNNYRIAISNGMSMEQYFAQYGVDKQNIRSSIEEMAKKSLVVATVYSELIEKYNIFPNKEEIEKHLTQIKKYDHPQQLFSGSEEIDANNSQVIAYVSRLVLLDKLFEKYHQVEDQKKPKDKK